MKTNGSEILTEDIVWPEPKRESFPSTLGGAVEYNLTHFLWSVLSLLDQPLITLGGWTIRVVLEIFEKGVIPVVKPLTAGYIKNADPSDPVAMMLKSMMESESFAAGPLLAGMASGAGSAGLLSFLEPFFEKARQAAYKGYPSKVFDPGTAMAAFFRGEIGQDELNDNLERFGLAITRHSKLQEVMRPRLPEGTMGQWALRDRARDEEVKTELSKRGYTEDDIDRFFELLEIIPPAPDQIRMAVREAFDPAIVKEYQLDADTYKIPYDSLEKIGLTKEWANYYWYAHWELPSVLMGYEMLHRGEIDKDQLETLMKSLDIMPGWIKHLIAISYSTFTRVDVRRMHKMGILDEAGVKTSYMEQGYDEDKATKMTEFTIAINTEEEREATKGDILTAYEEGVISRDEAGGFLSDIGYQELWIETYLAKIDHKLEEEARKEEEKGTDEELVKERELTKADILSSYEDKVISRDDAAGYLAAILYPASVIELLLTKVDYKLTQKLIREEIETTRVLYVNEDIDVSGVHVRLGKYALPATQIAELITLWNFERERKTERPSISQCMSFYYDAIYTEEKLRVQLAKHKLSPEYIDDFVADANYLILKREQAELERQQKEQERIAASEFKTDRMVQIAALNVNIQEYKVFIADQKVAMLHVVDPGEKKTMTEDMIIAAAEIVHLQLEIARVPVVPPTAE